MSGKLSTYTGTEVEITFDSGRCIHASECGRGSAALFNIANDPWCTPDGVPAEEAARIIARCPSGALSIRRRDGIAAEAPTENTVVVSPNGPLYFQGQLTIEGDSTVHHRLALCRCGASKNKPFCDLSHKAIDFKDAGPVNSDAEAIALDSGPLTLKPVANGPLLTSGPLTILSASGRVALRGNKAAFCRCGQSKNRPFCDGTHRSIGFTTTEGDQ